MGLSHEEQEVTSGVRCEQALRGSDPWRQHSILQVKHFELNMEGMRRITVTLSQKRTRVPKT